jgi:CheY-like chemotaxis protein/cell division protein FtsN
MQKRPILVVDNDAAAIRFISDTLKSLGHTVISATSGGEALEQAKEHAPALIFINLAVPDTAGLKICKSFMSIVDAPMILLTLREGKFDPRYRAQYGIVAFLRKPISAQELLEITSEHAPAPEPAPAAEAEGAESEGGEMFEIPEGEDILSASELEASLASFAEGGETLTPVEEEVEVEAEEVLEAMPEEDVSGDEEVLEVVSGEEMPAEIEKIGEAETEPGYEEEVPEWTIPETVAETEGIAEEEARDIAMPEDEPSREIAEEGISEFELPEEPGEEQVPTGDALPDWLIPEEEGPPWTPKEGKEPAAEEEAPEWSMPEEGEADEGLEPDWAVPEEEPLEEPPAAEEEAPEWSMPEEGEAGEGLEPDWAIPEEEPLEEPPAAEEETPPMEEFERSVPGEEMTETGEDLFEKPEETFWETEGGEDAFGFDEEEPKRVEEPPVPPGEPVSPAREKEYEVRPAALERQKRRKRKSGLLVPLLLILITAAVAGGVVLFFISGKGKAPTAPQAPPAPIAKAEKAPLPPPELPEAEVRTSTPAEKPDVPQEPSASEPPSGGKLYYVQFGAFRSKANADSLKNRLKDKGYDTFVSESNLKGKPLYLVLLSDRFTDKWTAFKQARQIKNDSDIGTAVHAE